MSYQGLIMLQCQLQKRNFLIFCGFLLNICYLCLAGDSIKKIALDFHVPSEVGGFSVKNHDSMIICYIDLLGARTKIKKAKFDATDPNYNFDGNLCTHLILSNFELSGNTLEIIEDENFVEEIPKIRSLKEKHPHLTILLLVVVQGRHQIPIIRELIFSSESRQKFIMRLITTLRGCFLDGILLDNYIYAGAPNKFNILLQEVKEEFEKENLLIAVEMNLRTREGFAEYPHIAEISRICDIVFINTYNFNYNNIDKRPLARHKAPLYSKEINDENIYDNLKSLFSQWQISRKSVVLTIINRGLVLNLPNDTERFPFGYNAKADSWGIPGPWRRQNRWGYDEICSTVLSEKENWSMYWDDVAKMPFLKNDRRWITFDNPRSVAEKIKLVNSFGLSGIAIFAPNFDDISGHCSNVSYPFLKTINYQLSRSISERGSQLCSLYSGIDNSSNVLDVNYKPVLILSTSLIKVPKGNTTKVKCTVEASPPFELSWTKANDTKALTTDDNVNIATIELKGDCGIRILVSTLNINRVVSSDNYFCRVSYTNGSESKNIAFKIDMVDDIRNPKTLEADKSNPDVDVNSSTTIWMTSIVFPSVLFAIAVAAFVFVLRRNKIYGGLTKQEITQFMKGMDGCSEDIQDPDNKPYDDSCELINNEYKIDKTKILGSGAFGVVFKGQVKDVDAAVKTTKPGADKQFLISLLSELKILSYIGHHPHIVNLMGAVTVHLNKGILYVFVELCPLGNHLDYLRKSREEFAIEAEGANEDAITFTHLFKWSIQISKGLCHLSSKNLIHGDLAARNVLLYDKDTIKITDFGLSRKLYEYTTYAKKNQEPLPWRWMAIESLRDLTFSIKSDVWSFGVTIWEIFSLGETPYPGLSWSCDFINKLEQNMRLLKPKYASDSLYNILLECWKSNPKERPNPQKNLESLSILVRTQFNDGYLNSEEVLTNVPP